MKSVTKVAADDIPTSKTIKGYFTSEYKKSTPTKSTPAKSTKSTPAKSTKSTSAKSTPVKNAEHAASRSEVKVKEEKEDVLAQAVMAAALEVSGDNAVTLELSQDSDIEYLGTEDNSNHPDSERKLPEKDDVGTDAAKKVKDLEAKEVTTMRAVNDKYKEKKAVVEKSKPVLLVHPPAPPRREERRLASSTSNTPSPIPSGSTQSFSYDNISPYLAPGGSGSRSSRIDPDDLDLVLTTYGDPQDVPVLDVTFHGLRDSERVYAEYLVRFDPLNGDLTGETRRNGVVSGVWMELHHFTTRAELDHMKAALMAISTRFFQATITTEIRLVNCRIVSNIS